jgi:hypothetical protein
VSGLGARLSGAVVFEAARARLTPRLTLHHAEHVDASPGEPQEATVGHLVFSRRGLLHTSCKERGNTPSTQTTGARASNSCVRCVLACIVAGMQPSQNVNRTKSRHGGAEEQAG